MKLFFFLNESNSRSSSHLRKAAPRSWGKRARRRTTTPWRNRWPWTMASGPSSAGQLLIYIIFQLFTFFTFLCSSYYLCLLNTLMFKISFIIYSHILRYSILQCVKYYSSHNHTFHFFVASDWFPVSHFTRYCHQIATGQLHSLSYSVTQLLLIVFH